MSLPPSGLAMSACEGPRQEPCPAVAPRTRRQVQLNSGDAAGRPGFVNLSPASASRRARPALPADCSVSPPSVWALPLSWTASLPSSRASSPARFLGRASRGASRTSRDASPLSRCASPLSGCASLFSRFASLHSRMALRNSRRASLHSDEALRNSPGASLQPGIASCHPRIAQRTPNSP